MTTRTMASMVIAVAALSWLADAETVQTQAGPVECWTARPVDAGVSCVTSNGVVTIPWSEITDERFPAPDLDPPASAEWHERIGRHYAEINGVLVRRLLVLGRVISVIPERDQVLARFGEHVVAVAGIRTDGLVDGSMVGEWCVRAGEYQYNSAGGGLSTVARYLAVPAISLDAFGGRRESAYAEIAEARAAARQAARDAAAEAEQERLCELRKKDEASRENARRMAEAARARAARLHEQYLLK